MPRAARKKSESGYYHVILRGIGRQILFEDYVTGTVLLTTTSFLWYNTTRGRM